LNKYPCQPFVKNFTVHIIEFSELGTKITLMIEDLISGKMTAEAMHTELELLDPNAIRSFDHLVGELHGLGVHVTADQFKVSAGITCRRIKV
jgi:hypothetical protein